jgi:hypothetical protein
MLPTYYVHDRFPQQTIKINITVFYLLLLNSVIASYAVISIYTEIIFFWIQKFQIDQKNFFAAFNLIHDPKV